MNTKKFPYPSAILHHNLFPSLPPSSFLHLTPSFSLRVSACQRIRGTTHSFSPQSSGTMTVCPAQGPQQGAPGKMTHWGSIPLTFVAGLQPRTVRDVVIDLRVKIKEG